MEVSGSRLFRRVKEYNNNSDRVVSLLLAIFTGLALFELTSVWPVDTHDAEIHIPRIEALTAALRAGVIYPRWFPDLMFGYGKPVLNYYSPGFYYPAALLNLTGIDLILSIRISLSVGFAFSAWWMFRLSRLFVSMWPAIVSVICFQFFPYRLYDLFIRGAFPEFSAFIWVPLIGFYTVRAAAVNGKAGEGHSYPTLLAAAGVAWACLILTHNLTALMAVFMLGVILALLLVVQPKAPANWLRIFWSTVPLTIGVSLTAWYVLPALLELGWVMNGTRLFTGIGMGHFLDLSELVDFGIVYPYNYPQDRPKLPLYIVPTVLVSIAVVWTMRTRKLRLFTLVALLLTVGLSWIMTKTSTWLWFTAELFMDQVQFPWRWQIFAALSSALLMGAVLEVFRLAGRTRVTILVPTGLIISVYLIGYAAVGLEYETTEDDAELPHWSESIEDWLRQAPISPWGQHLLPIWTVGPMVEAAEAGRKPWEQLPNPDPIDETAVTPTRGSLLRQQYLVTTDQTFRLLFHQFYFPSWRVTVDGSQVDVEPATGLGLASVTIPPGTHNVEIVWKTTAAVWLGMTVTAAGWIVVFILLCLKKNLVEFFRKENGVRLEALGRIWPPVVWLTVGVFMMLAASGATARTWDVSTIGADYGSVRLEGVRSFPPLRAGEVAPVHLTWLAKGPGEPVSAFVHLVDESGNGLSQHDGPPGGTHTPYQSWIPGLILYSTHNIVIPDTLPPGRYRLFAGLYYPEQANDPLVPVNGSNPRLEIGSVEVLP